MRSYGLFGLEIMMRAVAYAYFRMNQKGIMLRKRGLNLARLLPRAGHKAQL